MMVHSFQTKHLTPIIGTEIIGADLNNIDDEGIKLLQDGLAKRLVLVFRDQNLDRETHKKLGRIFGTGVLHRHALAGNYGTDDAEILPVKTSAESKYTAGEEWHTDVSCDPAPIAASLLYLKELPEGGGGDTVFSSMYEVYDRLSDPIKRLAQELKAVHDGALPWQTVYGYTTEKQFNKTIHPVVINHPVTGRPLLWVNRGFVPKIDGLNRTESKYLLDLFFHHIEKTLTAQVRVKWAPNTLVIWDNVATQHHSVWDYYPNNRYAERVSVIGPILEGAE